MSTSIRFLGIVAWIGLMSSTAVADQAKVDTGADLLGVCTAQEKSDQLDCERRIALAGMALVVSHDEAYCLPAGQTRSDMRLRVSAWLRNNPDELGKPYTTAIADSLEAVYPCSP